MPITYVIVTLFLKKARNSQEVADAGIDLEFVEYGMTNKLWEMEKTLYMGLIFLLAPFLNLYYYVAAVFLLMCIKTFTGGLHVTDTRIGKVNLPAVWHCFFWTLMTFMTGTYLLPTLLPLNTLGKILLALASIVITFLVAPVRNADEEELADKTKDPMKKWTSTLLTVAFSILFITQDNLSIGALAIQTSAFSWLLFVNCLQMLLVVYQEKKKNTFSGVQVVDE